MDSFLKNAVSNFGSKDDDQPKKSDHHRPDSVHKPSSSEEDHHRHKMPSNSELMSSAKLVADAAKSALSHDADKVDKGKVAGAAADLLAAASHYGKLEEKSFGKYVDKAENYLYKYETKTSSTTTTGSGHTTTTTTHHSETVTSQSGDNHHGKTGSGGGYGDYLKMAEGFLKK